MPYTRFARGPLPMTLLGGKTSYIRTASGNGLSAVSAAHETLHAIFGMDGGVSQFWTGDQRVKGMTTDRSQSTRPDSLRAPLASWSMTAMISGSGASIS